MLRRLTFLAVLFLPLVASLSTPVTAQEVTPATEEVTILGPEESYAGASLGEWLARWFQWTLSFPAETGPGFDATAERCGSGQFGPVFLLPANYTGGPVTRTCIVPEGTAIFVPLGGAVCSTVNPPPFFGRTEQELQACAAAAMEGTHVEVSVDGEELSDLERYRVSSSPFPLLSPEGNFFEVPAGVALTVTEGYAFIIAPPPPGEYEITRLTVFSDGTTLGKTTFRIIVEAPQVIEPEATPGATPAT